MMQYNSLACLLYVSIRLPIKRQTPPLSVQMLVSSIPLVSPDRAQKI
jgi:hypothetical protein